MRYRGTIAYRAGVGGMVPESFVISVGAALDFLTWQWNEEFSTKDRFYLMRGLSCMLHDSANQVAENFQGEFVLMLDPDHVFSSDALYEMILAAYQNDLDIAVGFAQERRPPYRPILFQTDFNPLHEFKRVGWWDAVQKNTVQPVDAAGLCCTFIRRRVFDAISFAGEKPFDMRRKFNNFDLSTHEPVHTISSVPLPLDRHIDEVFWEDISFFWRAKMLGFKTYCVPWAEFRHLETRLVEESMLPEKKG